MLISSRFPIHTVQSIILKRTNLKKTNIWSNGISTFKELIEIDLKITGVYMFIFSVPLKADRHFKMYGISVMPEIILLIVSGCIENNKIKKKELKKDIVSIFEIMYSIHIISLYNR